MTIKKLSIVLAPMVILVGIAFYAYGQYALSAEDLPYPQPTTCQESWLNEMSIMRKAWAKNVDAILEQEKPTSTLIDDAFGSLRTYQCWLKYLCTTVNLSGITTQGQMSPLKPNLIKTIPGCAPINELQIPGTKLGYMPLCNSKKTSLTAAEAGIANYSQCVQDYTKQFAPNEEGENPEKMIDRSPALIALEQRIKKSMYDKKTNILVKKLGDIMNKMPTLENNVKKMAELIDKMGKRIGDCFPLKCD